MEGNAPQTMRVLGMLPGVIGKSKPRIAETMPRTDESIGGGLPCSDDIELRSGCPRYGYILAED